MIVVSHDRYFLNRVADLLIVLRATARRRSSTATTTPTSCCAQSREQGAGKASGRRKPADSGQEQRLATPERQATGQAREAQAEVSLPQGAGPRSRHRATEKKVADLEAVMQTPDVYRDATRVRDTMAELETTKDALALLYQHWEEAVELNG